MTGALELSVAMTMRFVLSGKVASGETSITGTGGLLPGRTVTWKLHWLALPAASTTEQVTLVVPRPKAEPEGGLDKAARPSGQLSEAVGANVTTELQASCACVTTISDGQVMAGAC